MKEDAPMSRGMPSGDLKDRESCSFYEIDKEKVLRLQNSMSVWIAENYMFTDLQRDELGEISDELLIHRNDMIQVAGLFHAILQTGKITNSLTSNNPGITLERNEDGE